MKAVILVGGQGTRLRPLTVRTPKPMLPLVNQPFMEWLLGRLRDQGIAEVILAVQYLADVFREALGDGSRFGLRLHIVEEPEPRGTAGAVKHVAHLLDDTTFVLNGDVMTDLDLRGMLDFHRKTGSQVTISLTPVDDPTQFGLVEMDRNQRISRFLEKPRLEDITTNLVNAGTYLIEPRVFEYVPADTFYMFERGLFPTLLQQNEPLYGYPSGAYWTDIGKPKAYLEVQHDILIGKVQYRFRGTQIAERVWAEGPVQIDPQARLVGPIVLGEGVTIGAGSQIIGPTVIGAGCRIAQDCVIEGSVLWEQNDVGREVQLRQCLIGRHNRISSGTQIGGGAVISDHCSIGAHNRLDHGIRIWPGTTIDDASITF